ncbi:MAG: glycosyltransferase family 4 protein, partial [Vicinamibacterales bacterium]
AVASHPIQYQAPWYRELAKVLDLEVFFCHEQDAQGHADAGFGVPFEWDVPLLEGYRHRWLRNVSSTPGVSRFSGCDTPEIAGVLATGGFDACIVNGWYLKSYVQAIRACRRAGIKVLVRGDSHLRTPRSTVKSALKYLPYRWFLGRIDAHLYVGRANREYLQSYGVADERLFFVPHFVDNEFFARRAAAARENGSAVQFRRQLGARESEVVFMFVGKFIEKKRPADFVRACALAASTVTSSPVRGVMVGDGPLRAETERLAASLGAPVSFAGFRNQSQLPVCYAAADALVLASDARETWGLVVNEAMACGVPAIVTREAGCADDLIEEGSTGFTYTVGDVERLAHCMTRYASADRTVMRERARARVAQYTVERAVQGTMIALQPRAEQALAG